MTLGTKGTTTNPSPLVDSSELVKTIKEQAEKIEELEAKLIRRDELIGRLNTQ